MNRVQLTDILNEAPFTVILNEAAGVVKDLVERDRPDILNGVKDLGERNNAFILCGYGEVYQILR